MRIGRQIVEKILGHCSKCGGCPVAKLMDAKAETKDDTPAKKTLRGEAKS
ncbi:MAG TPA: hypothetical protein HA348_07255 [Thermoplasmata archaeon]|nr:hypothetical protein [Thermoplasmata archaeon]